MRRGPWHQCGDRGQIVAREMLDQGLGVGVVISPRDLARHLAVQYSQEYHERNAHVLLDPQFYKAAHLHKAVQTYEFAPFWKPSAELNLALTANPKHLGDALRTLGSDLALDGIIAPAVMYEAGRPDLVQLNAQLFAIARGVGDQLSRPVYATAAFARSVTSSDPTTAAALAAVSSLPADGWYLVFEFGDDRIPSNKETVSRFVKAGLTLACTGKPVFHAFAGPMSLLSPSFGATGVGVGHSQNLWHVDLTRWAAPQGQRGGGDAPPRFFSRSLWGTIVVPDELMQLPAGMRAKVITGTPYSAPVGANPPQPWSRWDANKHLVYCLASHIAGVPSGVTPLSLAKQADDVLKSAVALHAEIAATGLALRDQTNIYQNNWHLALESVIAERKDDYDYLELLL